jgi:hypothetical protein
MPAYAGLLLGSLLNPENEDDIFLRNIGGLSFAHMTLYPRR